jgi:arsenate reductase
MRILFLCRDNGARSQMAEGLARQMFAGEHEVLSAGVEPATRIHALVLESMREINIDLGGYRAKGVGQLPEGAIDLVVLVCERDISADVLPRAIKRLHWPIMDPFDPPASDTELRRRLRDVRMALSKHLKGLAKMKIRTASQPTA